MADASAARRIAIGQLPMQWTGADNTRVIVGAIGQACACHRVAASVGTPTFAAAGDIRDSQVFTDDTGTCIGAVDRRGLTEREATLFARGSARPVVLLQGHRSSAATCREVEDLDEVGAQLAPGAPEVVFRLPGAEPGVAIFAVGDRGFNWSGWGAWTA